METDVRYPTGRYESRPFGEETKKSWLADLEFLPTELEMALQNLDKAQLDTPYREGGWTVNQLVHHVADSHMHAYIRFKLGLTEDKPVIKPYEEKTWVLLDDVKTLPVNVSITLLHALHQRWHNAIKNLSESEWQRTVYHPEHKKRWSLWYLLGLYAWHGKHHVAHITKLREQRNW